MSVLNSVLNIVNSLSLVVTAASLTVIAYALLSGLRHLETLSGIVPPLVGFLNTEHVHDPDPHHHYSYAPAARNLVVWEWRDGHWTLRPESGPLEQAGTPPNRPGKYDGECVTSRRKG